jgi:hypothetical protein
MNDKYQIATTVGDRVYTLSFDTYEAANEVYVVMAAVVDNRLDELDIRLMGPEQ